MRDPIEHLSNEVSRALKSLGFPETEVHFEKPKDPAHGDIATNVALSLTRQVGKSPFEIAQRIAEKLSLNGEIIAGHTVAKPGFINFTLSDEHLRQVGAWILEMGAVFADGQELRGSRILLEFVSANPSGPLNIVSARAAAVGDSLRRILSARGARVDSEYYVNDAGNQVRLLGESLRARYETLLGYPTEIPEEGYHGA
ncbi:MAG: arginine--tRNA ligase, partial [Calditrichaeota bacterium]|nr:arginine--tRNA ligase [Calditrichota bacterium]